MGARLRGVPFVSIDVGNERTLPVGLCFSRNGRKPPARGVGWFDLRRGRRGGRGLPEILLVSDFLVYLLFRFILFIGLRLWQLHCRLGSQWRRLEGWRLLRNRLLGLFACFGCRRFFLHQRTWSV